VHPDATGPGLQDPRTAPRISVIIPTYNEADSVDGLIADLASQDVGEEFEVIVADGRSTDGTPVLFERAAGRAGINLKIFENPRRYTASGLNICIRNSRGDIIVRWDAHTRYPSDYVRRCVEAVRETGAWNAAGVFTAIGRTPMERAVACALDSPFGGHNWTRKLAAGTRIDVDTNYLGAFPREALERVGLYDDDLLVVEVEDLNLQLRKAGGRVVLDPDIRSFYYPRGSFAGLFMQYFRYGYWKAAVMAKHRQVVSVRSVVPCAFVLTTAALAAAGIPSRTARRLLLADTIAYGIAGVAFGAAAVHARGESPSLLPRVVASFGVFHVAHGTGMVAGALRLLGRRRPTP
jgi:succinoglycan biosynthesis protein ExoA